ncbi:hypothetical protein JW877_06475 [bacterium]|nr:hypothetical protein [bacterium]
MEGIGKMVLLIVVGVLIVFLIGFIPPKIQVARLRGEVKDLNTEVEDLRKKLDYEIKLKQIASDFTLMYLEVEDRNYGNGEKMASALCSDLKKFAEETDDQRMKEKISLIMDRRDITISYLAKGNPIALNEIREQLLIFLK